VRGGRRIGHRLHRRHRTEGLVYDSAHPGGKIAHIKPLPDIVADDLLVLFCGINPGLRSAADGHNFARPGNRFWPALHGAGFTPRQLAPHEDGQLPGLGLGITNLVDRPTRAASELSAGELREGAVALEQLARRHRPAVVAVVGIGAWRTAFGEPRAAVGRQERTVGGRPAWVLPNPSGLNAHHQLPELVRLFGELRAFALETRRGPA
jgi:TDG/mug DNA glycosylase family protein